MAARVAYVEDTLLVDRCLGGEQAAARELFRRESRRVHATLYRVLGSNSEIDDLLQDTFVQVFQSLSRYRAEAKLSTWIDRIAVRVAYRYLAKRRRMPVETTNADELGGPALALHDHAVAREGVRRFYAAVHALPPAARIAYTLFAVDGRSVAEVAEVTGATVTATKVRLWRARRALSRAAAADPVLAGFVGENAA